MKLELISHATCPFVHRAAIVLREKGVPFERKIVDLKNKPDWFLAISPRAKVPVLIADGIPLFESSVIVEFIDETHPPRLMPDDPFERARQRAWVEVANDLFGAQFKLSIAVSPEDVPSGTKTLEAVLAIFESAIGSGAIDTDRFGLIDVALAPALYRFILFSDRFGVNLLESAPKVAEWARRLAQRPSVKGTVPDDFVDQYVRWLTERGSWVVR